MPSGDHVLQNKFHLAIRIESNLSIIAVKFD